MKTIIKITIGTIAIGVIAYCLNLIFGNAISYIQAQRYNNVLFYTYDFYGYLENLRNSFTGTTALSLDLPSRTWIDVGGTNWWDDVINNMALMLDYIIFAINILLWPLRLGAYLIRAILAIIGINVIPPINHNLAWLVNLINGLIEFIQIPYV